MTDEVAAPGPPPKLIISLDPPIQHAGQTYEQLELREPTVKEVEDADGFKGVTFILKLTSAVSGVPEKAIQKLGIRTLNDCSAYLMDFIVAGRPTATNS